MPNVLIHTFSNAGYTWNIYADFDTQTIETNNDPPPQQIGPTVDATILGFAADAIIIQSCGTGINLTTLYQVKAQFAWPYAYFETILNSPACGYMPPVTCSVDYTLTTTDAVNGNNNGRLTVTIPPDALFYKFSIDNGATWQDTPNFTGLFPGFYTLIIRKYYIRSRPFLSGCNVTVAFSIGNNIVVVPSILPIPYQDSKNLCYFFRLLIGTQVLPIREPVGWDVLDIQGKRDPELHGWTYQFSDGEFPLKFDCSAGGDLIKSVYESAGQDGDVGFQYGFNYGGNEYLLFDGAILLGTYTPYPAYVQASVKNNQFDETFLSRLDTPVSMAETEGFDGGTIIPPTPYSMELHAKQILTQLSVNNSNRSYADNLETSGTTFWVLFGIDGPVKNDIDQTNIFTLLSTPADPVPNQFNIKFTTGGVTDISFAANITIQIHTHNTNLFGSITGTYKVVYLYRKLNANGTYTDTSETISNVEHSSTGALSTNTPVINLIASKTITGFNYGAGDEIYFFTFIEFDDAINVYFPSIVQFSLAFTVAHYESSAPSLANVWFLDDALRHIINVMSDGRLAFRSSFLERANFQNVVQGQAARRVLTNGFQIRNFDVADRPLKADFSKLVKSLNAQNCIGADYAVDNTGAARVRIERRDFFYRDNMILAIEDGIEEYYEQVATDIIYNEAEFGYDKFLETGFNSLDEFNTRSSALTPIQKNLKKLSQIATVITSGYTIEDTRRQQFADTPTNSYDNDDNTFMMAVRDNGTNWVPEKNEPFSTATNVISPETSYNLRLDWKRMYYNWFIWLKGIFAYKATTEKIKITDFKQNGDLTTQFDGSEVDVIGDIDRDLIIEKDPILLSKMNSTATLIRPEWVNVVCRLSPDKVQLINAAMTGQSDDTKNYGYIMVLNPKDGGIWQAGYIYDLKYNYAHEKATFKMLKKYLSPEAPVVDCCAWLSANDCYVIANGQRIIA